jgi:hypothetical protein
MTIEWKDAIYVALLLVGLAAAFWRLKMDLRHLEDTKVDREWARGLETRIYNELHGIQLSVTRIETILMGGRWKEKGAESEKLEEI